MKRLFTAVLIFFLLSLLSLSVCVFAESEAVSIEVISGKVICLENAYGEYIERISSETGESEKIYYYYFTMPDDVIMRVNYADGTFVTQSINKSVNGVIFKWFGNYQIKDPWIVGKENYITVEYLDLQAKLPVEIIPNPIEYIETVTPPEREYIYADNEYGYYDDSQDQYYLWPTDLSGFSFVVHYKDNSEKVYTLSENSDIKIDGYPYKIISSDKPLKPGNHLVTFYYMGHTTQYKVSLKYHYEPFPDVDISSWYYEGAKYCAQMGYLKGTDKGLFEPNKCLTREQFAVILARHAADNTELSLHSEPFFSDVKRESWYSSSVEWVRQNGLMKGIGNGKFGVGLHITRQELATVLYRYSAKNSINESVLESYTDTAFISEWAATAMNWAVANHVLGSTSNNANLLSPQMSVTRSQAAKIFMTLDSVIS